VSVRRGVLLTGLYAALALAVVYLRAEQTRSSARALKLESRWAETRRELWDLQTQVSRLCAPRRVRDTVEWFGAGVVPPGDEPTSAGTGRLVSDRESE